MLGFFIQCMLKPVDTQKNQFRVHFYLDYSRFNTEHFYFYDVLILDFMGIYKLLLGVCKVTSSINTIIGIL